MSGKPGAAGGAGRLRVLILLDWIGGRDGGAERVAGALAKGLALQGHEVTVCATRKAGEPVREQLERAGVRVESLGRRSRMDLLPFRRLAALIRQGRFDVLHAHKFGSNVWGVVFGRLLGVPVVIAHEHTWAYDRYSPRRLVDFAIGRLATVFVSVSEADRRRMIALEWVPPSKTRVMPNPHIPRPCTAGGDLRVELGLEPEALLIGTAAVLRPQKAIEVMIEAFGRLAGRLPEPHLVIAGYGPERAALESAASATGHSDRIHFLGQREDIVTVLDALDIAVMSSDFEGAPLFVLECMAHAKPLVATRVGGIPDMVSDGESAVLVPPRDPGALADAIGSLARDPARRLRIAAAAKERAHLYTVESVSKQFAELYRELLDAAASGAARREPPLAERLRARRTDRW